MSKAITEQPETRPGGAGVRMREMAPSIMREEEPTIARWVGGGGGLFLLLLGGGILLISLFGRNLGVSRTTWGTVFFCLGLLGLLYHASADRDMQIRRTYGVFGGLWLIAGVVLALLGLLRYFGVAGTAGYFVPGVCCLGVALLFLLAFVRTETDEEWRRLAIFTLGGVGAAAAVLSFLISNLRADFLLPEGLLLSLAGLSYLWAFVSCRGESDDLAYQVSAGAAILGAVAIFLALVRAYLMPHVATSAALDMVPNGVVLIGLGLLYVLFYVLLWVDVPLVVMTRRELAAFFYSPIAYLVLLGFTLVGWWSLFLFLNKALSYALRPGQAEPLFEPVVRYFFLDIVPVFALIIVPLLSMRLLSEEKRTGTLELLLTVPVSEVGVVLSKFLATLAFFMLLWVPWVLFLAAVAIEGHTTFDIRPLLCFLLVLLISGAGFVSMGLFFSSITRNQIIAAVLSFAGMIALLAISLTGWALPPTNPWVPVLTHLSFVDLWFNSLDGKLQPQFLMFPISATIFWLFLTVKVLEARRWS